MAEPAFWRYSQRLMEAPPSLVVAARVTLALPTVTVKVAAGGWYGTPATTIDSSVEVPLPTALTARTWYV